MCVFVCVCVCDVFTDSVLGCRQTVVLLAGGTDSQARLCVSTFSPQGLDVSSGLESSLSAVHLPLTRPHYHPTCVPVIIPS